MFDRRCEVVAHRDLGAGVRLLRFRDADVAADVRPGTFVMLEARPPGLGRVPDPVLPRPFSVQRVRGDVFDVMYRVVGVGTTAMADLRSGDTPRVLGPLGNSFTLPEPDETAVLLGGGVGIPPMVALADALVARDGDVARFEAYLGVSGAADRGCMIGFDEGYGDDSVFSDRVFRATMDGSFGFRGHVVAAWLDRWESRGLRPDGPVRLYACGPMIMLRAVAAAAAERGLRAQVSVETMMGCGIGICMGCVIENKHYDGSGNPYDRWLLACRQGPVFDADAVVLDDGGLLH
jgi:dihydroorotate dehydrogenase electron transfer subunit